MRPSEVLPRKGLADTERVLVTGGAGFIGSNLVRMLLSEFGCSVTVVDNMFTGTLDNLRALGVLDEVELIEGSVLDRSLLQLVTRGKDTVFHLAAVNIVASTENPRSDLEVNIAGTFNVLEVALGCNCQRVVYASTSSVYGNARYLPVNEEDRVEFLNFYAVSKYAGEGYALTFYEQYGLPVTIVRYSNVYGYNQRPDNPYAGVVAKFVYWALNGEPLRIHGDGNQTRDFTFVLDACRATILAAQCVRAVGEVYNVGTGVETSINNLARLVLDITGSRSEILYEPKRPIDNVRRRVLNVEKARRELRFFPEWSLNKGLEETVNWVKTYSGH